MKSKLLKVSVIAFAIVLLLQVVAFATIDKLTLKTLTDKDTYTVGEKVTATIDWEYEMESAGFNVKYDSSKLKFINITDKNGEELEEDFFNAESAGLISFNWFTASSKGKTTKMIFTFESTAEGKATISVEGASGFGYMDENSKLAAPNEYDTTTSGSKEITITVKTEQGTGNDNQNQQGSTNTGSDNQNQQGSTNTGTNNQNSQQQSSTTNNNKKDDTTADGKMPQTGAETTTIIAILALAILGTAGFIGYRRLSDI